MHPKYFLIALIFLPSVALANIGIPLLMYMSQWQVMFLIPIILIEAFVLYKIINLNYLKAVLATFIANIASTLLGVIVSIPTFFLPFMAPWGTAATIALILFLYPFYRLSVWSEHKVLKIKLHQPELHQALVSANQLSYFLLLVFLISSIIKSYFVNGYIVW